MQVCACCGDVQIMDEEFREPTKEEQSFVDKGLANYTVCTECRAMTDS